MAGPYLTTRDAVKAAFGFDGTEHNAAIDALLPQVTKWFQTYSGRVFFAGTFTEYPPVLTRCASCFFVKEPPIGSVTSLHISSAVPRVYDATTLLVEGTDYIVDETQQWIELVNPRDVGGYGSWARMVKLVYAGGYATIPADLQRAAEEVIGVKVSKGKGKLYHLTGTAREDGSVAGIRFEDMTPHALQVLDAYRLPRAA